VKYKTYKFPKWAEYIGWCIALSSILAIPMYAIVFFARQTGSLKEVKRKHRRFLYLIYLFVNQRWIKATTPTIDRSPSVDEDDNETKQRMLAEHATAMTNL